MKMYDGGFVHTFSQWSSHLSQWVSHDVPHHFPNARWCPSEQNREVGAFITPISRTGFCYRFISTYKNKLVKTTKLKEHHIGKRSHQKSVPIWFPYDSHMILIWFPFLLHLAENLTLPSGNLPSGQGFTQLDSSRKSPPHRWNFWGNHRETRRKT